MIGYQTEKVNIPAYKVKAIERCVALDKGKPKVLGLTVLAGSAKEAKKLIKEKYRVLSIERLKPIIINRT